MLAALAVSVELGACASTDEDGALTGDDSGEHIAPDSGALPDANGDGGTDSDPCVPGALCPVALFGMSDGGAELDMRTRINVIRGRSPSDVWAGGAAGAIAHFDGTTWKRSETRTVESIRGLWLRDTGEMAWMSIAPASTLVRGIDLVPAAGAQPSTDGWLSAQDELPADGTTVGFGGLSSGLTAVWSTSDAEWLWGTSAMASDDVNHADGLWRARIDATLKTLEVRAPFPAGTCLTFGCWWMEAIHGATADDLWAVGRGGVTLHVTGAQSDAPTLTAVDSQTWMSLKGVWATGREMFAVGGTGTIRHYSGTGDTLDIVSDVPVLEALNAVWGTSPNDVWAVGENSCVIHWDGTHWSRIAVGGLGGRRPDFYTVWTGTPGKVWIGGDGVLLTLGGEP